MYNRLSQVYRYCIEPEGRIHSYTRGYEAPYTFSADTIFNWVRKVKIWENVLYKFITALFSFKIQNEILHMYFTLNRGSNLAIAKY